MDSTGAGSRAAHAGSAKLAVLIDADNIPPSSATQLMAEISKYGTAHVKRAYGDWTGSRLTGWKSHLLAQSIQPMQQFCYTTGKNSTDSAMIIDAMDLLYADRFDGFCLVSSDSDFTRLASRIRESGRPVYGFGEAKTPRPFVVACDRFVYVENLMSAGSSPLPRSAGDPIAGSGAGAAEPRPSPPRVPPGSDAVLHKILRAAVVAASDEDGWADLGLVGHLIGSQHPDFDQRSYGCAKLSDLFQTAGRFDLDRRRPHDGKPVVVYARLRPTARSAPSQRS
jgi:uncharacterized LabA/DUF88 family protein